MTTVIGANNPKAMVDNKEEEGFTYYYTAFLLESRASELEKAWPELQPSLEKCGVSSCTLNLTESLMTASITRPSRRTTQPSDSDNYKAQRLLDLLATTNVPPSLAIELALNDKITYDLIKIGLQEDGFAWEYGIDQKRFVKRRECFEKHYLEALEFATGCDLYLGANTLTAVATTSGWSVSQGLLVVRNIVEQRIRYGPD